MGGMRKDHRLIAPFTVATQHSQSREEVERGSVCVCERERKGQHVGKREFTFREGICLG